MTDKIPQEAYPLLDDREFATLATIDPDGRPQLSVVWVSRDGGDVVFSTVAGRRKHTNLARDPRCSLLVFPRDRPYTYLEVRGRATMSETGARELIDDMARRYTGAARYTMDDGTQNVRVVARVHPERVVFRG